MVGAGNFLYHTLSIDLLEEEGEMSSQDFGMFCVIRKILRVIYNQEMPASNMKKATLKYLLTRDGL